MGKLVQIADVQAQHLEQLAAAKGTTESPLVEQALELLFGQSGRDEALRTDKEALQQLEAEGVLPSPHQITPPLNPDEYQMTHAVRITSEMTRDCASTIRRLPVDMPEDEPAQLSLTPRTPGLSQGEVWIAPDFDASMPDEWLEEFYNGELFSCKVGVQVALQA